MAPDAGFEPATKRLTAAYSTAELIRNLNKGKILWKNRANVKVFAQIKALILYFIVLLNACDILAKNLNHLIFAIDFATHIL